MPAMSDTLNYLLAKRMWWVSGVNVWGTIAAFEPQIVVTEMEDTTKRIVHARVALGGSTQKLAFGDMLDAKGNKLPELLANPRVLPIAKGGIPVIVQGSEDGKSFTLAKAAPTAQIAVADLLIIEMG
jgi:hypothetical protein